MLCLSLALVAASIASGAVIRPRAGGDPPFQDIPTSAQPDNTFNNGAKMGLMPPENSALPIPEVYGARKIDLPFSRLYHGNMKFFPAGQLNTPDKFTDAWIDQPGVVDSANQSACGIPDNAFSISKVAIHPYFLKFAPLDRYCMQDVCISFWNGKSGEASSDMMLKVTDVCSTDPNDPTHCEKPGDIKVDRTKVRIMQGLWDDPSKQLEDYPQLRGDQYTDGEAWWFFVKCWADGIVQPAYQDNWFAKPALPNNLGWSQQTATQQWKNNNISYPLHSPAFSTYPNGAYNPQYDSEISPPITDWSPSDPEPEWCPVAGGKGWGNPTGKNCGGSQQVKPAGEESSTAAVASTKSKVSSAFGSSSAPVSPASTTPAVMSSAAESVGLSSPSASEAPVAASSSLPTTSEMAVAASSSSSTPVFPSATPFSNSTTGVSPGYNGLGSESPEESGNQVGAGEWGKEDDGETCDTEPEVPQEAPVAASSSPTTSEMAVAASSAPSTPVFPSATPFLNSKIGVSPGYNGLGSESPEGKEQVSAAEGEGVGEDNDETCDTEPEVPQKAPQQVVTEEEEDDTCEW